MQYIAFFKNVKKTLSSLFIFIIRWLILIFYYGLQASQTPMDGLIQYAKNGYGYKRAIGLGMMKQS